MKTITYSVTLNEAAIFAALEGDPNASVSHPYIPGSAIRGILIEAYIRLKRENNKNFVLDAADNDTTLLFFSRYTRYLNAYPEINGSRALPVPATWTQRKYKTAQNDRLTITDGALSHTSTDYKSSTITGFTSVDDNIAYIYKPVTNISVHNTRARLNATEQQVFRYESLADGQTFMGAILCDDDNAARYLAEVLDGLGNITIGGSRTAGYGAATIHDVDLLDDWQETSHKIASEITLTFLSDCLLRDNNGVYRPTPDVLEIALARLGIVCQVESVIIKTTWVGGFNRKWGLPLPQCIAIERGSVVRLHVIDANPDKLQALIQYGLGERLTEGFGRVALNWQRTGQLTYTVYSPHEMISEEELTEESKKLRTRIRNRIRERRLDEKFAGVLYDQRYTIHGHITRTQISRLRSVIANELKKNDPSKSCLLTFLNQIKGKAAGRQFDAARIASQSLSGWLEKSTFAEFGENILKRDQYVLKLVDIVLERAYRVREKQEVKS